MRVPRHIGQKQSNPQWSRITPRIVTIAAALLITGCRSGHSLPPEERPVSGGRAVQVVAIDSTTRPFNRSIEVITDAAEIAGRPHRKIALLSIFDWPEAETKCVNALVWRAKSLGADAVVIKPRQKHNYEFRPFAKSGSRYTFSAEAILFTPPTASKPAQP